jgi:hypothetical protein
LQSGEGPIDVVRVAVVEGDEQRSRREAAAIEEEAGQVVESDRAQVPAKPVELAAEVLGRADHLGRVRQVVADRGDAMVGEHREPVGAERRVERT